MKSRKTLVVFWALALACGGIASYVVFASNASSTKLPGNNDVKRFAVGALGRIEPHSEIINLGAGLTPDRLETLFVGRGDPVKKGQVLGHLGGHAEQVAQRGTFRAQLEEAKRRLQADLELNLARIEASEAHQKQVLKVSPLRMLAQEAAVVSLEAKLANDKDMLNSGEQLFARGNATRRVNEDQKAIVAQGEANVAAARARLAELKQQFEIDQIDAAVQLKLARAQLARAQADSAIESLESQIKWAESRAHRMTLFAPVDGRILNIKTKPGENVSSEPVLTMGNTGLMRAVAEIYETDVALVKVGQLATITSRALATPLVGKVVRIGNMVFKNDVLNVDPAARADARIVEVWIDLDDGTAVENMTNLTVNVVIDTAGVEPAVATSGKL